MVDGTTPASTSATLVPIFSNFRKWQDGSEDPLVHSGKIVDQIAFRTSDAAELRVSIAADGKLSVGLGDTYQIPIMLFLLLPSLLLRGASTEERVPLAPASLRPAGRQSVSVVQPARAFVLLRIHRSDWSGFSNTPADPSIVRPAPLPAHPNRVRRVRSTPQLPRSAARIPGPRLAATLLHPPTALTGKRSSSLLPGWHCLLSYVAEVER